MVEPTQKPTQPGRLWRIVLVLSLMANLIVVGLVAGAALSGRTQGGPRGFDMGLGPLSRALSGDDMRAIRDTLKSDRRLRPPSRADHRRDAAAMSEALRAVPFDVDAVRRVMQTRQDRGRELISAAQSAFLDRLTQMSDAERAAFAQRLETAPARGGN